MSIRLVPRCGMCDGMPELKIYKKETKYKSAQRVFRPRDTRTPESLPQ